MPAILAAQQPPLGQQNNNDIIGSNMANKNLTSAKRVKNDEFYTQYADIQKEIEAYLEYSLMALF